MNYENQDIIFPKIKYLLNILIKSEDKDIIKYYEEFNNHHLGDSGIDLINKNIIYVKQFEIGTIDFEIQCEMINLENNEYTSYYLIPRSSISNTCFQMANSIGLIDAGYRGNIKAKVRNCNFGEVNIPIENSLFQITSPDLKPIKINIVNQLSDTTRNNNGFGSTNK